MKKEKENKKEENEISKENLKILLEIYREEDPEDPPPVFALVFWLIVLLAAIYYRSAISVIVSIFCIISFMYLIFKK